MDVFEEISDLLNAKGDPCDFGCNEDDFESIKQQLTADNPSKAMRAVKNWLIWDLEISASEEAELRLIGLKPSMVYSTDVIWDRFAKFELGTCIRSTLLVDFSENFLFETRNTLYILVGPGTRKNVTPRIALSITF